MSKTTKLTNKETVGIVAVMYLLAIMSFITGWLFGFNTRNDEEDFDQV